MARVHPAESDGSSFSAAVATANTDDNDELALALLQRTGCHEVMEAVKWSRPKQQCPNQHPLESKLRLGYGQIVVIYGIIIQLLGALLIGIFGLVGVALLLGIALLGLSGVKVLLKSIPSCRVGAVGCRPWWSMTVLRCKDC